MGEIKDCSGDCGGSLIDNECGQCGGPVTQYCDDDAGSKNDDDDVWYW